MGREKRSVGNPHSTAQGTCWAAQQLCPQEDGVVEALRDDADVACLHHVVQWLHHRHGGIPVALKELWEGSDECEGLCI